ncbi:MAG: restriction endonuclease subunit S, partial [Bacteroidales bacterium]|nr:restriction endonuclease subunit S [Bacteroidales bacterium]
YARLADLVNIKKSIEPGSNAYSDEGLPFLRVADYNKFGISEPQKCLSDSYTKENAEKLSELKPKAETILFSKDGSVGTAYMLKENMNLITSGAVLHLTVKNKEQVLPEYLTLVLNSQLVQMQAERDAGGSIILHWRVGEIENVIIPIIDLNIQQQISNKIEESFRLKKQSEQLLELAKTAVEKAIEEDEGNAMRFIEDEMKKIIPKQ